MKPLAETAPGRVPCPPPDPSADADPRLGDAVRAAFDAPCPSTLTDRILAAARDEERAVRAWQAPWLFAVLVLELALLLVSRRDIGSLLSPAERLWRLLNQALVPRWQGGADAVRFWWLSTRSWCSTALSPQLELLPWVVVVLAAAALAGTLIFRQEKSHA